MSPRICSSVDCSNVYDPVLPEQMYCSDRCATRERVRRYRDRLRQGGGNGPGGGKKRQLALFSKQSVSAKRAKQPHPETAPLFTAGTLLAETGPRKPAQAQQGMIRPRKGKTAA
jgi:hypothetical protein